MSKRHARITAVILLALTLAACGGGDKKNATKTPSGTPAEGTLTVEKDHVEYKAAGSDAWTPVTAPQTVRQGDSIRTDTTGSARLNFYTGTETELLPGVELTLTTFEQTADGGYTITLHQLSGETEHRVARIADREDRYVVETPSATLAVRGTEFGVEVKPDGTTTVEVREGVVQAQVGQQTVEVGAGQALDIRAGQTVPSTPYPIPVIRPPAATATPTSEAATPVPTEPPTAEPTLATPSS